MRTAPILVGLLVPVALAAAPGAAFGQAPTPVRYNEGPGVKLSDALVLHPGAAVEMRYDSNVLFADRNLKGAPYLRLVGHLDLSTRSAQRRTDATTGQVVNGKVDFRLKSALSYREYLSGGDLVRQQRALEVDAGMSFTWLPSRYFNLELADTYGRTVTPLNTVLIGGASTSDTIARNVNRALARLKFIPGGGRLTFDLGYALNLDAFEEGGFDANNRLFHELLFTGRWRLLPKTAIFIDVKQQIYDYYNAGNAPQFISSKPFRAYLGFAGLFTPRFSALAKVGYGNSLHDSGEKFSSVVAKAEGTYKFAPTASVKAGYERSFEDSFFGNFFEDHQVYAGYDHMIAGRFLLHLKLDYRYRTYRDTDIVAAGLPASVNTNLVSAGVGFDWQIKDWVYVGIGYDLQVQDIGSTLQNIAGGIDYARHQMFGKVGVSY